MEHNKKETMRDRTASIILFDSFSHFGGREGNHPFPPQLSATVHHIPQPVDAPVYLLSLRWLIVRLKEINKGKFHLLLTRGLKERRTH